jgi:hypothetical protein
LKLFALPDGVINRKDRAQWLTIPFDLAFAAPSSSVLLPLSLTAGAIYTPGLAKGAIYTPGLAAGQVSMP